MDINSISGQSSYLSNGGGSEGTAVRKAEPLQTEVMNSANSVGQLKEVPGYIPTIQEKTVINAIEAANKKICGVGREAEFSIHEKTKQIMIKIVDKETKEIVKEIPSEKVLDMVAKFYELNGLFVDEKR